MYFVLDFAVSEDAPEGVAYQAGETEGFKWSLNAFRRWLSARESPEVYSWHYSAAFDNTMCMYVFIYDV
jgi:hypothetical protein